MSALTFMHLRGLWLLAALAPLILLYILKARRRRVVVSSLWLWRDGQRDLQSRVPWRKLVREASLLLEIAALLLLALALASPACRGRTLRGRHVAIVIDRSASMQASDGPGARSRIVLAREAARRLVDSLAMGSDAMLVGSGRDARVLVALGRDRAALRRGVDQVTAVDVEGDLSAAVNLAVDRLRPLAGDREVIVVTDGAAAHVEGMRTGTMPVHIARVGQPIDNTALVRLDVRTARQDDSHEVVQVFALVAHHADGPRDVYVTVRRDASPTVLASRRLRLNPNAREAVVLSFPYEPQATGAGVVVEVSPHDALAVDDTAYGRVPPGTRLPVALISRSDSPWLQRALASDPFVDLHEVQTDSPTELPDEGLIVFDGLCPGQLPPQIDVAVFAPPAGRCADVRVGEPAESYAISSYASDDPRFRFLTFEGVNLLSATPLGLGAHATDLARSAANVVIADSSTSDRSITIVGFDPAQSDWPLRASFVLFVRNLEELARAHRARGGVAATHAGDALRVSVPPGVRTIEVSGPFASRRVAVASGTAVLGDTERVGLYRLRWNRTERLAPVNLLSDAESDLRAPSLRVEGSATARDPRALIRPHEELTPYVLLAASFLLLANLFWLTRRERAIGKRIVPVAPSTSLPSGR